MLENSFEKEILLIMLHFELLYVQQCLNFHHKIHKQVSHRENISLTAKNLVLLPAVHWKERKRRHCLKFCLALF